MREPERRSFPKGDGTPTAEGKRWRPMPDGRIPRENSATSDRDPILSTDSTLCSVLPQFKKGHYNRTSDISDSYNEPSNFSKRLTPVE